MNKKHYKYSRVKNYDHLQRFFEQAKNEGQFKYLLKQIFELRNGISVYGKQLYRNRKLNILNDLEEKVQNRLKELNR